MKVIWEASDIRGGRRFGRPSGPERWMICNYETEGLYAVVSLAGRLQACSTAQELADDLNEHGYRPEELL